jgi:hypothetical protein
VTERGFSNSFGAGVRVGWIGTINQSLSVGATFQTKTYMQKLDQYKGLFAEQGGFDIPANVAGGVALVPRFKSKEQNTNPATIFVPYPMTAAVGGEVSGPG